MSDLDFIVQELTLKDERIAQLENTLWDVISQLIDKGFKEDGLFIQSIKNQLNK